MMTDRNTISAMEFDSTQLGEAIKYINDPSYGPAFATGYLTQMKKRLDEEITERKEALNNYIHLKK